MGFLAAFQFLTIMPPLVRRMFTAREMGRAVGYLPLVGLALGGLLYGLDDVLQRIWPIEISAALVLLAWVVMTGALHLDGFLDSCDGLLGGRNPEERLRIMKDERVGAFAVVGGILLLLIKYVALASIQDRLEALMLAPLLGRWGMALAIVFFPYARADGLGRSMKDNAGWREVILATVIAAFSFMVAGVNQNILAMALTLIVVLGVARFTLKRLPGLTGDIYGAICEIVEVGVLLQFAARTRA